MSLITDSPLPQAITAGVTTGHVGHSIRLHDAYDAMLAENTVNVMHADYGAVDGGSAATNTTAINLAVSDIVGTGKPGRVVIPLGVNLPVTPGGVLGASDVYFGGGGCVSTSQTTAGYLITFPAGSTDCGVDGLVFEGPNFSIRGIYIKSASSSMSDGVTIRNNRTIGCALVLTNDEAHTYAGVSTHATTGNVTRNVHITGNTGKRTATNLVDVPWILLHYTIGGEVLGNTIDGSPFGIQWWGGDAAGGANGALANERKCGEFTITANIVRNISAPGGGAGIWGSMGYDITVTSNNVKNCNDVGIDFEGCFDCEAIGNVVTNCTNGCLTTFFISVDILFASNVCKSAASLARVANNTGTVTPRVRFVDNDFRCTGSVPGLVLIEACETVEFSNNDLRNCGLYTRINNQKHLTVDHNTLDFTVASAAAFNAIDIGANNGGAMVKVRDNTVRSSVSQPAGSRGLYNAQIDSGTPPTVLIEGNHVNGGFPISMETDWSGPGGNAPATMLRNNIFPLTKPPVVTEAGGIVSIVVKEGNRYEETLAAWP